ncbi:hypothetical protein EC957_003667 [Mortierella hygrophila]|uniref:Uncharacterized protein n=1 Tax=Mortierella hygrophila TaxID=979708 RepID=A0A9P6F1J9_9FUNG|nr:hypothetical protein EC957_003667 [Mortierella hygrophila]
MAHYPSNTKSFKHKQIATIHVTAPQASINEIDINTFFYRPNIKLRSVVMDPAMMCEKLYIDMLNSAGIPSKPGEHLGKNPKEDPLKDLIELMRSLQDFDPASTPDPVGFWNSNRPGSRWCPP